MDPCLTHRHPALSTLSIQPGIQFDKRNAAGRSAIRDKRSVVCRSRLGSYKQQSGFVHTSFDELLEPLVQAQAIGQAR